MFGITTWKASDALPPCAVGSVSRSTIFICSITEPGQPWQTTSGSASSCLERTWTKWMSSPSISVMKCGHGVQPGLALAPVVLGLPVARERLHRRQLHALRGILDALLLGPARGRDARTQVLEVRLGDLDRERADRGVARRPFGHDSHVVLLRGDGGEVTARSLLRLVSHIAPVENPGFAHGAAHWVGPRVADRGRPRATASVIPVGEPRQDTGAIPDQKAQA